MKRRSGVLLSCQRGSTYASLAPFTPFPSGKIYSACIDYLRCVLYICMLRAFVSLGVLFDSVDATCGAPTTVDRVCYVYELYGFLIYDLHYGRLLNALYSS